MPGLIFTTRKTYLGGKELNTSFLQKHIINNGSTLWSLIRMQTLRKLKTLEIR
jgi:hypothetical protein